MVEALEQLTASLPQGITLAKFGLADLKGEWKEARVADATGGLHAAHSTRDGRGRPAPILHCDVSTSNILVSVQGEVKLTDFGLAARAGKSGEPGRIG